MQALKQLIKNSSYNIWRDSHMQSMLHYNIWRDSHMQSMLQLILHPFIHIPTSPFSFLDVWFWAYPHWDIWSALILQTLNAGKVCRTRSKKCPAIRNPPNYLNVLEPCVGGRTSSFIQGHGCSFTRFLLRGTCLLNASVRRLLNMFNALVTSTHFITGNVNTFHNWLPINRL